MSVLVTVFRVAQLVALAYVLVLGYRGLARLALSMLQLADYAETLRNSPYERQPSADHMMPVTIILPDSDLDAGIVSTVSALLQLDYPEFEVVAVCSELRGALPKLAKAFALVEVQQPIKKSVPMGSVRRVLRSPKHPNLIVVDKKNYGRADALNTGVNISRYPLVATVDYQRRLAKKALAAIAMPFMKAFQVGAVGGLPRISPDAFGILAGLQRAEFIADFPIGQTVPGQKKLPLVSGAFGAFRKVSVIAKGGFANKAGELEMAVRLYNDAPKRAKNRPQVQLLAEPVYDMDNEAGLRGWFRLRRRWQKELLVSLWQNRKMTFNPAYGRAGLWDIPQHWLFDVIGPVLELFGCVAITLSFVFGLASQNLFLAFWAAEILLGMLVSLAAVMSQLIVDNSLTLNQVLWLVAGALVGNIGYRQLVLVVRVAGMVMPYPKK